MAGSIPHHSYGFSCYRDAISSERINLMNRRSLMWSTGAVAAAAIVLTLRMPVRAEDRKAASVAPNAATAGKFVAPRTPWGDPDLAGVWDYRTITPLERPQNMGDRQFLTDAEAATLEARAAKRLDEPPDGSVPANTIHAPYWTDPGRRVLDDKRTSLI